MFIFREGRFSGGLTKTAISFHCTVAGQLACPPHRDFDHNLAGRPTSGVMSLDSPNRKRESACRKPLFYRDKRYQLGKLSDNRVTRSRKITTSLW